MAPQAGLIALLATLASPPLQASPAPEYDPTSGPL